MKKYVRKERRKINSFGVIVIEVLVNCGFWGIYSMSSTGELNSYAISSLLFVIPFLKEGLKTGYGNASNFDTKFKKGVFIGSIIICIVLTSSSLMMVLGWYDAPTIGLGIASKKVSKEVFAYLFVTLIPFPILNVYY